MSFFLFALSRRERGPLFQRNRGSLERTYDPNDSHIRWSDEYDPLEEYPREEVLNVTDYLRDYDFHDGEARNMDYRHRKSVTFRKRGQGTITVLGGENQSPQVVNGLSNSGEVLHHQPKHKTKHLDTQWYTRPLHLGRKTAVQSESSSSTNQIPPQRHASPANANQSESTADSFLSDEIKNNSPQNTLTKPNVLLDSSCDTTNANKGGDTTEKNGSALDNTLTPMDNLARSHFPVTLGTGYDNLKPFNSVENNNNTETPVSPPPNELNYPDLAPWRISSKSNGTGSKSKRPGSGHSSSSSRSRSRKSRPDSAQSSSSSASKGSLDRMYLMQVEAPITGM